MREAWEESGFGDEEAIGDYHHWVNLWKAPSTSAQEETTPLPYSPAPRPRLANSSLKIKLTLPCLSDAPHPHRGQTPVPSPDTLKSGASQLHA